MGSLSSVTFQKCAQNKLPTYKPHLGKSNCELFNGPLPVSFLHLHLLSTVFNTVEFYLKFADDRIQTADLWMPEATVLPTEPQPLWVNFIFNFVRRLMKLQRRSLRSNQKVTAIKLKFCCVGKKFDDLHISYPFPTPLR